MLINRIFSQAFNNVERTDRIGRIILVILTLCLIFLNSCEKEPVHRVGFDSPIEKESSGLTILHVGGSVLSLSLEGRIEVTNGEVLLELTGPNGATEYTEIIQAGQEKLISSSFQAKKGFWKLKYKSNQGLGTIDLHLASRADHSIFF